MTKTIHAVALSNSLETIAAHFADCMAEGRALQAQLGDVAREAAKALKGEPDNLAAFVDCCRQLCAAHGMTDGTVDKTLSQLRGVVRAILTKGYEPAEDLTLRAMYEAIPKDATKGGRKPRQSAKGAQDGAGEGEATSAPQGEAAKPAAPSKADMVRALFGHCDDALLAAVEYAVANEAMFARWAEASAKAAQAQRTPLRRAA